MFKVTAQIKYGNRVVGYRFEGLNQSNKIIKNIPKQSLQQFCQTNSILNARYNTKTNSLVGLNGQDLRKLKKNTNEKNSLNYSRIKNTASIESRASKIIHKQIQIIKQRANNRI